MCTLLLLPVADSENLMEFILAPDKLTLKSGLSYSRNNIKCFCDYMLEVVDEY